LLQQHIHADIPEAVTVGNTNVYIYTDTILRITHTPSGGDAPENRVSLIVKTEWPKTNYTVSKTDIEVTILTTKLKAVITKATGIVTVYNVLTNDVILQETEITFTPTEDLGKSTYEIEQSGISADDEALYGGGEFQNGLLDFKNAPIQLVQFNTEAIVPFFVSSKGHGILWDNYAWSWLNPASLSSALNFSSNNSSRYGYDSPDGNDVAVVLRGCDSMDRNQLWTFNATGDATISMLSDETLSMKSPKDRNVLDCNNGANNGINAANTPTRMRPREASSTSQQWKYHKTTNMLQSMYYPTLCLTASSSSSSSAKKNHILTAICDSTDPLQMWEHDDKTNLLSLFSSIIGGSRRVHQQQFNTYVSNTGPYEGAMCLSRESESSHPTDKDNYNFFVKFTPKENGDHFFYIDACPNSFGCGMGKTLKLWIKGRENEPIIDWDQLTNLPSSLTGRASNLTEGVEYTIYFNTVNFDSAPIVLVRTPSESGVTTIRSAIGDLIDYYVTYGGESMDQTIKGYRELTGDARLYADWAYGFWQCNPNSPNNPSDPNNPNDPDNDISHEYLYSFL